MKSTALVFNKRYRKETRGRPRKHKLRTKWFRRTIQRKLKERKSGFTIPRKEEDLTLYNQTIERYQDGFKELCEAAYTAYYGLDFYPFTLAGEVLHNHINKATDNGSIELSDIENRLRYIWFDATRRYYFKERDIPFHNYLFRMSLFELKKWLNITGNTSNESYDYAPQYMPDDNINELIPTLDVNFVVYGVNKLHPLSVLTPYERYLIFLRYTENVDISVIAKLVGHYRCTVTKQLDEIIDKLREAYSP